MFDQARALESAQKSSGSYCFPAPPVGAAILLTAPPDSENLLDVRSLAATRQSHSQGMKHYFCGLPRHPRIKCPAREATSNKCQRQGHFAKVCRCSPNPHTTSPPIHSGTSAAMGLSAVASLTAAMKAQSLDKSTSCVKINGRQARALMDGGSSQSFINPQLVELCGLPVYPPSGAVSLALASQFAQIQGYCKVNLALMSRQ